MVFSKNFHFGSSRVFILKCDFIKSGLISVKLLKTSVAIYVTAFDELTR